MRNDQQNVIYAGKAKRLRNRLASYFQNRERDWKTLALVNDIADIEVILVNNEIESLVLENNLIKFYHPPYNRMLMRDDTGYSYIVLTDESLPRFVPYKKHWINKDLGEVDANSRFGPYPSRFYRDNLLDYVRDRFKLRTCNPLPRRVCLRFHLGTCTGVCEGRISRDDYLDSNRRALTFLRHPNMAVVHSMKNEMVKCVDSLEFERAERIKTQLNALIATLESQIVERDVTINQDVLYFGSNSVLVMCIKQGVVLTFHHHPLFPGLDYDASCSQFLLAAYADRCPAELISNYIPYRQKTAETLSEIQGHKVRITLPQRGMKRRLLALCKMNFEYRITL